MLNYKRTITKNCRHFYKFNYHLNDLVDRQLLVMLESLGFVEINLLSKYSSNALDTFKIKFEDMVLIEGVINGSYIIASIKRSCPEVLSEFESILSSWSYNIHSDNSRA